MADFDTVIDRYGTASLKYDYLKNVCPTANEDTIPMFVADMDFRAAQCIIDALESVVQHGVFGYTLTDADPRYAETVCRWWREQYECHFAPEAVVYCNGTVNAVKNAIRAFTNEGDGVILQRPVYGHFTSAIENECHRRVVDNHLLCDSHGYYTVDFADLEAKCADPANKVMVLCSPANPVGRVWMVEELQGIAAITRKHGVILVSDEVHCDIVRKSVQHQPILNVVNAKDNIIMLTAINKTFNLAGLQCSNAIIPDETLCAKYLAACEETMPTPFTVPALLAAYSAEGRDWMYEMNAYIDQNLQTAVSFLALNMPWVKTYVPEGTYCLWMDFSASGLSDEEVHRRIYTVANVVLQDGIVHDPQKGQCFQRMCVSCARSVMQTALTRIAAQFADVH